MGFAPNGSTFNLTAHRTIYLSLYALIEGKGPTVPFPRHPHRLRLPLQRSFRRVGFFGVHIPFLRPFFEFSDMSREHIELFFPLSFP